MVLSQAIQREVFEASMAAAQEIADSLILKLNGRDQPLVLAGEVAGRSTIQFCADLKGSATANMAAARRGECPWLD